MEVRGGYLLGRFEYELSGGFPVIGFVCYGGNFWW